MLGGAEGQATPRRHLLKPAELPHGSDHAAREEGDVGEGGRGRDAGLGAHQGLREEVVLGQPPVEGVLGRHCHVAGCRWPGRIGGVSTATASYKGHRYPVEIINHCVWLYFRFSLSFREVEELMLARGVVLSCETIRRWCAKFGQAYANQLRRRRPRPGDKWHLDEVFVKINGITHYLWRAVDQHGNVLDVLVQSRRNAKAAKRFFRKLLKGLRYVPRVLVTDKLASYGVAHRELMPSVTHRQLEVPEQSSRELSTTHPTA